MLPWDLGQLVQLIGYPGLAAIIFAESGLLIGFFLPGASLLFTAGFLASQGFFDIRIIIPLVTIAAILGDNVGYWFGAKVGIHLFNRPDSRFFKREYLERTRRFYAKYGTRTILFARFVPVVRTFAPILAGVVGMDYKPFMLYNLLGAFLWASGITYLGYILGAAIPQTSEYIELVVFAIIVVTCIPLAKELWQHRFERIRTPKAVLFDLDDTLVVSWQVPSAPMIEKLGLLLEQVPVAIMSAASFPRIEQSFLPSIEAHPHAHQLYVYSYNGAELHILENGIWKAQYSVEMTQEQRARATAVIKECVAKTRIIKKDAKYQWEILEREQKIVFSALGLHATQEDKRTWDPGLSKRKKLQRTLRRRLRDLDVNIGGTTTIDITAKGINKGYATRHLAKRLGVEVQDMLFIGDALYPGGNDYIVMQTGADTRQVQNPEETEKIIETLLDAFEKARR
jgi:membrane-associated protein